MFVRNKHQLVVDCYPPAKVRLLWITIFALLGGLAWSIWGHAPAQLAQQRQASEQGRLHLMERLGAVEKDRARLKADVTRLQTMKGVDEGAYKLLRENYNSLQAKVLEMQEQIAFYQAVVGPDQGKEGLKIQRFRIESDAESGTYVYSLVLVQAKQSKGMVSGSLRLGIHGRGDAGDQTLGMDAVTEPAVSAEKIGFRYFQNISGRLRLPAGFVPERVKVTLDLVPPGKDVTKTFSWAGLKG